MDTSRNHSRTLWGQQSRGMQVRTDASDPWLAAVTSLALAGLGPLHTCEKPQNSGCWSKGEKNNLSRPVLLREPGEALSLRQL